MCYKFGSLQYTITKVHQMQTLPGWTSKHGRLKFYMIHQRD